MSRSYSKPDKEIYAKAMRRAVDDIRKIVKTVTLAYPGARCAISGAPLTAENLEVDHAGRSFRSIRDEYIDTLGGWERVIDEHTLLRGTDFGWVLRDPTPWQQFHGERARLRAVSREAHAEITAAQNRARALLRKSNSL